MCTVSTTSTQAVVSQPVKLSHDERGVIEQLAKGDFQSVLRITSKKGTVRANHYHKKDWHICYLVSGKIRYVERPAFAKASAGNPAGKLVSKGARALREYIITPGQLFYSAPMMAHAMEFLEDSEFLCFTPRTGVQAEYEDDVVRVTLIDPHEAALRRHP